MVRVFLRTMASPAAAAGMVVTETAAAAAATSPAAAPSSASRPEKLHGLAFYESIGSPKFIVAPMVDQSEFVRVFLSPRDGASSLAWLLLRLTLRLHLPGLADAHEILLARAPEAQHPGLQPHAARAPVYRNAIVPRCPLPTDTAVPHLGKRSLSRRVPQDRPAALRGVEGGGGRR